jgi:hypothetical protein
MTGKRFRVDSLANRLAQLGFAHNFPASHKNGFAFVRNSSIPRLYEHVLINAENPVYAEAVISAASRASCHPCVSERDGCLRALLSSGSRYGSKLIFTPAEAKAWQDRLIENADASCRAASSEFGPLLFKRLEPVLYAVDRYQKKIGEIFAVFDREFAFVQDVRDEERSEIERLAAKAHSILFLDAEDAKLASLVLVRFGSEVEGIEAPFQNANPRAGNELGSRLILLVDFIQNKRRAYAQAGGRSR